MSRPGLLSFFEPIGYIGGGRTEGGCSVCIPGAARIREPPGHVGGIRPD